MNVSNNYKFLVPTTEKYINLPVEIKWDFIGRQDDIEKYQEDILLEVVGSPGPFEISRYSHNQYGPNNLTSINYEFYFYNSPFPVNSPFVTSSDWVNSYIFNSATPSGFSPTQIYYYQKPFRNSFFKLDFYDTPNSLSQKNYFTVILPTQQGKTESVSISPLIANVNIKKPSMVLDFVGDKEGFFFYWLKTRDIIDIDTFYMSAKFFDARLGVWVRMMNVTQKDPSLPNPFIFDNSDFFYKKVVLNYDTKKYEIFDNSNVRIGNGTPITWYEYVNP